VSAITGTRVDEVLQQAVESGTVPNVVATAADRNGPIYAGAFGPKAKGKPDEVTVDTIYRIASMTKMVTTVAALQLHEQGKLNLDDPVSKYRPEFADLKVLDGWDGDEPILREPASEATVRQLATHTSGLSYWFWNADIVRWEAHTSTGNALAGTADAFTAPLVADPGTRFEYGVNTDWLGKVVEAASGQPLDEYFDEHIFAPLNIENASFHPTDQQRENLVAVHLRNSDTGEWEATDLDWNTAPDWWAGGHGLYVPPSQYLKFQRMLLNGGTPLLQPGTVDAAFSNQIGDLDFPAAIQTAEPPTSADFNAGPGYKFGLGLLRNEQDVPGMRKAGSGAWAGIFNTHFWVDPTSGITGAIYTQTLPFVEPDVFQVYSDFEQALYASL
jgi:CubicO group peptidase (beta-lactamase class C family)